MNPRDAYARLLKLDLPVVRTSEVAAALRVSSKAANMVLVRLDRAGLASRIRKGIWKIGPGPIDRYAIVEQLTAPMPAYISLQSALYLRGMIEQIPGLVFVVSLAETGRISTAVGAYSVHHITPELFLGFETRKDGTKLATPEKALFDMAYLSGGRSRLFAHVPELELPPRFNDRKLRAWTLRIAAPRRRSMVESRLRAWIDAASRS
jgi:predicted transcriptional regulator of viral defense system